MITVRTASLLFPSLLPLFSPHVISTDITPSDVVRVAVREQRALGYDVCEPRIGILPAERAVESVVADATVEGCEIRVSPYISSTDVVWVAWHEVCHLSTIREIARWEMYNGTVDAYHTHFAFKQCLNLGPQERGGY